MNLSTDLNRSIIQPIYDIAELCAQKGIKEAIICPGSRSAPLTISFARHPHIRTRVIPDERSAAYIALGMAQITGQTVAVICTSGTAVLNFGPAIAEAYYQQIPLLFLTADRPPEWVDQGNGQTIRQSGVFEAHVKKGYDLPVDYSHKDAVWQIERIINEATEVAQEIPQGPVHINVPLREPLYQKPNHEIIFSKNIKKITKIPVSKVLDSNTLYEIKTLLKQSPKILLLPGQLNPNSKLMKALEHFEEQYPAPIIGEITTNMNGELPIIYHSDSILATENADHFLLLQADTLITFGNDLLSRNLKTYFRNYPPKIHFHISEKTEIFDPLQSVTHQIQIDPSLFFEQIASEFDGNPTSNPLVAAWTELDSKIALKISEFLIDEPFGEFPAIQEIMENLPSNSILHLSNSMSVRYANLLGSKSFKDKNIKIFANRGTSGIDGCTSTALGAALQTEAQVFLITGDMAFVYDRNAFWNNYIPQNLKIIVLNNHGGVIFRLIDGPRALPELEEYFETMPPNISIQNTAETHGLKYSKVTSKDELINFIPSFISPNFGASMLEIETNGQSNESAFSRYKQSIKLT